MHINKVFFSYDAYEPGAILLALHFYGQNFLIIVQIDFMEYKLILIHS